MIGGFDTPEHQAQRAAWAMEDAAREAARSLYAAMDPERDLRDYFYGVSGLDAGRLAGIAGVAYAKACVAVDLEEIPKFTGGDIASWAAEFAATSRRNGAAIHAEMMRDHEYAKIRTAEAVLRRAIDRMAARDLCRNWMTTAERVHCETRA